MKLSLALILCTGIALANAASAGVRGLRSDAVEQVQCAMSGSTDEDTCVSNVDESGDACVWCSFSSLGLCVSADEAKVIEDRLPMVTCSNDSANDDDDDDMPVYDDDDDAPAYDDDDDDDDSNAPDDYWKCVKEAGNENDCESSGCTWCMTGAGYGLCFEKEAAKQADKSDWFDCGGSSNGDDDDDDDDTSLAGSNSQVETSPYDMSCVIQTAQGDSETCKTATDEDGQSCEWCSLQAHEFCLSAEQAEIFQQLGASCDERAALTDINDTTCILQTLEGEATCEQTVDQDGDACRFCSLTSYSLCLNEDQAELVEQMGGDCGAASSDDVRVASA